ncbi:11910_t:CDS:2, partial [Gigaspora rosea]
LKLDENTKDWDFVSEWNIHPNHLKASSKFFYRGEVLGNGDLAMITSIGLLIWSIWKKDKFIRLRYYKGFPFQSSYLFEKDHNNRFVLGTHKSKKFYEKIKLVEFGAKKSNVEKLLEEIQECKKNSLPPPDFDVITQYCDEFYMDERLPLRELLDDYLEDKVIMSLYGQELISSFLKNKDYQMMERLYNQSIDFLVNIKLLEIITYSFMSLTMKFPGLLKEYLSRISLILSSTNKEIAVKSFSSKSHLKSLKVYSRPFNISLKFLDIIFKKLFIKSLIYPLTF